MSMKISMVEMDTQKQKIGQAGKGIDTSALSTIDSETTIVANAESKDCYEQDLEIIIYFKDAIASDTSKIAKTEAYYKNVDDMSAKITEALFK